MLQSLDTVSFFTWGEPLNLRTVMRRVTPLVDREALIWEGEEESCFGQIEKEQNKKFAQMCYLGCSENMQPLVVCRLLEALVNEAGTWKAWGVLADLPEGSDLFEGFRKAGFTIWARQKVFKLTSQEMTPSSPGLWRSGSEFDKLAIDALSKEVVPAAAQLVDNLSDQWADSMVAYQKDGRLGAFANIEQGPKGIWVSMTVHPEADAQVLLSSLIQEVSDVLDRPIYLAVRSYQPHLENVVARMGFGASESQILLVKYLVVNRALDANQVKKIFETGSFEGSTTFLGKKD